MKLGELLISAGRITPAQVEETLKGQAIFGGRFGTNLVEMGYLDEHDLAHFLSKKTGIPHALPEQLMEVTPQVTRLIPEEAVRKYRAMPLALNNRKLTVAMADPTDFASIDELSFITGYIVVPVITPELRLISALEKHYNIRRELRYIRVEGGGRNRRLSGEPAQPLAQGVPAPPKSPVSNSPARAEEEVLELPLLAEFECFGEMGKSEPPPSQAATLLPREEEHTLEAVLRGFTEAKDRHRVAELIVAYAARQFDRSALFLLKGEKATGWVARSGEKPVPGFDTLEIPLAEPSVLKVVAESRSYYLGALPSTRANGRLTAALGGGNPVKNLLLPLAMGGRVVAILYVEGGSLPPERRLQELQRLLSKGSLAFEILILKAKILAS